MQGWWMKGRNMEEYKVIDHLRTLGMDFDLNMAIKASVGAPWMLPAEDRPSIVQWLTYIHCDTLLQHKLVSWEQWGIAVC